MLLLTYHLHSSNYTSVYLDEQMVSRYQIPLLSNEEELNPVSYIWTISSCGQEQ